YITCPSCANRLHVPENLVGKKVKCPHCESTFPVPEMTVVPPDAAEPVPVADYHPSASGTKIAAGICGILLGALGIHKFVLGMTLPGLIMLLVTVLTCGLGWVPMHL